ncbi:hypothetical protein E2562_001090 [Oryza meyeriana var. granulata]|uniref:WAT1-related protein n=1 Tax=Oryza meyeriana var. granulata TaxID=110450 RepID=A0A6G1EFH3_9ORYZ|nr:hypothetical protein E2562_001090 [Oryza meyeriana var. granulata]
MENLRLKSMEGSAKVTGALVCFGGALLIGLYNGKELHLWRAIIRSPKNSDGATGGHHLRGTLLLLGESSKCILMETLVLSDDLCSGRSGHIAEGRSSAELGRTREREVVMAAEDADDEDEEREADIAGRLDERLRDRDLADG